MTISEESFGRFVVVLFGEIKRGFQSPNSK